MLDRGLSPGPTTVVGSLGSRPPLGSPALRPGALRTTFSHEPFGLPAVASLITSTVSSSATSYPSPQVIVSTSPSRVWNRSSPAPPSSVSPVVSTSPLGPGWTSLGESAQRSSLPSPP